MLTRRGFTLIELLITIVLLAIVGLATARILRTLLNSTTAQMQIAGNQGMMRTGMLALPLEFREIGYDTIPLAGQATTDLEAIAAHRITFRAMRGMSTTCGTPTLTEFRVRKPVIGVREPVVTDGFLLFVENDPNYGLDDQWVTMNVTSIDLNSTCG
jgi:prepilin-type N-terminal cleavage/methylation domain-containing protein